MDEDAIVMNASIQGNGCLKGDSDGATTLKLTIPASELDQVTTIMRNLMECDLIVVLKRKI